MIIRSSGALVPSASSLLDWDPLDSQVGANNSKNYGLWYLQLYFMGFIWVYKPTYTWAHMVENRRSLFNFTARIHICSFNSSVASYSQTISIHLNPRLILDTPHFQLGSTYPHKHLKALSTVLQSTHPFGWHRIHFNPKFGSRPSS